MSFGQQLHPSDVRYVRYRDVSSLFVSGAVGCGPRGRCRRYCWAKGFILFIFFLFFLFFFFYLSTSALNNFPSFFSSRMISVRMPLMNM